MKKRLMVTVGALGLALFLSALPSPAHASCYKVPEQPDSLNGVLQYRIYPGPPNYEDVKQGDKPLPAYVLLLDKPICIDDGGAFADPENLFSRVHLVPDNVSEQELERLLGKSVQVKFTYRMAAHTGWHHEPLVAWVASISSK